MLAGVVAWRLLAPVPSTYRRGGLSVVTAFATVLPMLLCMAANQLAGRAGLVALAAAALCSRSCWPRSRAGAGAGA